MQQDNKQQPIELKEDATEVQMPEAVRLAATDLFEDDGTFVGAGVVIGFQSKETKEWTHYGLTFDEASGIALFIANALVAQGNVERQQAQGRGKERGH